MRGAAALVAETPAVGCRGTLMRMVESQEQVATRSLVDGLTEQALLENLLETSKPPLRPGTEKLHYLLAAPFRYPPLRHGSRFGSRFEPGIFYGSHRFETLAAETAYYRFVFWRGMTTPPPSGRISTEHTAFSVNYATEHGLRLQDPPFARHKKSLASPSDYAATQATGAAMRAKDIAAFEYLSARDPKQGLNVGLFTPAALKSRKPLRQQNWLCETNAESVQFRRPHDKLVRTYGRELFLVAGSFPEPAE
ncbi:MAG: RES family NAD+ phosphorylase [Pseudomonadota bacterium]